MPPAPSQPRRLAYLGTPDMAVPPLNALVDAGFEIVMVITRPDKRRGRGSLTASSPVKRAALDRGLPVAYEPDAALDVAADLGVVVAYGRIIRPHVLDALPMVNLHFSLLPRWRGAAPVERAILAGDARTGVCVMAVEEGLDTGGIYASATVGIRRESTADELRQQLVSVGTPLLLDTLQAGLAEPMTQEGEVTYAEKVTKEDLRLDWKRSAVELHSVVRVGGAWTTFRGRQLKVRAAHVTDESGPGRLGELHGSQVTTGDGMLELLSVQAEGKGEMSFQAWANGAHPEQGEELGGTSPSAAD